MAPTDSPLSQKYTTKMSKNCFAPIRFEETMYKENVDLHERIHNLTIWDISRNEPGGDGVGKMFIVNDPDAPFVVNEVERTVVRKKNAWLPKFGHAVVYLTRHSLGIHGVIAICRQVRFMRNKKKLVNSPGYF